VEVRVAGMRSSGRVRARMTARSCSGWTDTEVRGRLGSIREDDPQPVRADHDVEVREDGSVVHDDHPGSHALNRILAILEVPQVRGVQILVQIIQSSHGDDRRSNHLEGHRLHGRSRRERGEGMQDGLIDVPLRELRGGRSERSIEEHAEERDQCSGNEEDGPLMAPQERANRIFPWGSTRPASPPSSADGDSRRIAGHGRAAGFRRGGPERL
jgi:hypothetical protein